MKTVNQIQRPLLGLAEDTAEILTNHAKAHQLQAAQEKNYHHQGRIPLDRIPDAQP